MARVEVWNEVRTLFTLGPFKVVEVRLFVAQDDARHLPTAFQMLASIRILGAQIDDSNKTNNFPVKDGPVGIPIAVSTFKGNVDGTITNLHGTDSDGAHSTNADWASAEKVSFTLMAVGKVTVPVADILTLVPGIGGILRALLTLLPGQHVSFTIGHVEVDIPIHRVNKNVVLPTGAVVAQWWS